MIGTRIPSCGLTMAATTAQNEARSGRRRHRSRTLSSTKITPTASTWPQMALSNQVTGLTRKRAAPMSAARREPPSSRTIEWMSQATTTSETMAGSLIRSPMPPIAFPTTPSSHRT